MQNMTANGKRYVYQKKYLWSCIASASVITEGQSFEADENVKAKPNKLGNIYINERD